MSSSEEDEPRVHPGKWIRERVYTPPANLYFSLDEPSETLDEAETRQSSPSSDEQTSVLEGTTNKLPQKNPDVVGKMQSSPSSDKHPSFAEGNTNYSSSKTLKTNVSPPSSSGGELQNVAKGPVIRLIRKIPLIRRPPDEFRSGPYQLSYARKRYAELRAANMRKRPLLQNPGAEPYEIEPKSRKPIQEEEEQHLPTSNDDFRIRPSHPILNSDAVCFNNSSKPLLSINAEPISEISVDASTTQEHTTRVDEFSTTTRSSSCVDEVNDRNIRNQEASINKPSFYPNPLNAILENRTSLCNSWKQLGQVYSQLGAVLKDKNIQSEQILRLELEKKQMKNEYENEKQLLKKSEALVASLDQKLKTMLNIVESLKEEKKQLVNKIKSLSMKGHYTASIQSLKKYKRIERVKHIQSLVDNTRGFQETEAAAAEANKLIIKELATLLNVELGLSKLTPFEDFEVFLKNGVTFDQRAAIKKSLISHDLDILAPTHAVFKWKKDFENSFKDLYATKEVEVKNEKIPVVFVRDLNSILQKKLASMISAGDINLNGKYGGQIWLGFVIDKGADYTKLIMHIGNCENPGSLKNSIFLGIYKGDEDSDSLRACFSEIVSQVNSLETVKVDSHDIRVAKFFTGDMKSMCASAGIQSCSSLFFCLYCLYRYKDYKTWATNQTGTLRTFDDIVKCATAYSKIKNKLCSSAAQSCFSITHFPLFNFPISNYIPSSLHIFLGIGNLLIKLLEFEVMVLDLYLSGFDVSELKSHPDLNKLCQQLETQKKQFLAYQKRNVLELKTLMSLHKIHSTVANPQDKSKKKRRDVDENCQAKRCVHVDSQNYGEKLPSSQILTCLTCQKWFHSLCQLYVAQEDIEVVKRDGYICDECQIPLKSKVTVLEEKMKDNNKEKETIENKLTNVVRKLEIVDLVVTKKSGETYLKLQETFVRCGAYKNAYFLTFNGNHLRKLFEYDSLFEIFNIDGLGSTKRLLDLQALMTLLQKLQDFSAARFLEDVEIAEMETCISSFVKVFTLSYPDTKPTAKMHWMSSHLMHFVKTWKTWGLISEHAVERFHCEWNKVEKRFVTFQSPSPIAIINSPHASLNVNVNVQKWPRRTSQEKNREYRKKMKERKAAERRSLELSNQ